MSWYGENRWKWAGEAAVFVINHFSHNGGLHHRELCEKAGDPGFTVAWGGFSTVF